MKLFQKLFNKPKPEDIDNTQRQNELCSIVLAMSNDDEYNFEVRWNAKDKTKTVNALCNLMLGLNYGFFAKDILEILKEYDSDDKQDKDIVKETITNIEAQTRILENIVNKNRSADTPWIKPSEVLKHDS
tara:strand:+ start:12274 stop:12663 length:390 start_codon:yes stop_codon:yes gene_type:complete